MPRRPRRPSRQPWLPSPVPPTSTSSAGAPGSCRRPLATGPGQPRDRLAAGRAAQVRRPARSVRLVAPSRRLSHSVRWPSRRSTRLVCWSTRPSTSACRPRGARGVHGIRSPCSTTSSSTTSWRWAGRSPRDRSVEAEWMDFDALNLGHQPSGTHPAGHHLGRSRRPPRRAAHPRLARAGPHDADPRAADLRDLPGSGVPQRGLRRHAQPDVPPGRGPGHRQGHLDGPPQGHPRPVRRAGCSATGITTRFRPVVLPLHRAVRRGRPGLLRLPGRGRRGRALPDGRARAGSSGAGAGWSTRASSRPAASTARSIPASPSAWGSTVPSCSVTGPTT